MTNDTTRHDAATFNEVNALINRAVEGFVPFSQRLAITNRFLDWHQAKVAEDPSAPQSVVDREALESRLTDALIVADELVAPGYSARIEADADDIARVAADAVLALINESAT